MSKKSLKKHVEVSNKEVTFLLNRLKKSQCFRTCIFWHHFITSTSRYKISGG